MATNLRINELTISTGMSDYTYSFRMPVTAIVGPIGCGKSSLLEVVKHTMGGSATLTQAVEENVIRASVGITAGADHFVLQRAVRGVTNTIDVRAVSTAEVLGRRSVREAGGDESLSRLLLNSMGIPAVVIPRSRSRAAAPTSSLTFNDIYSYIYLQQAEIDRSVVYHLDAFREPKRKATFELLFGLTEPDLIAYEVERGQITDLLRAAQARTATVRGFLQESSAGDEQELAIEHERLRTGLIGARARLDQLRQQVRALSAGDRSLRDSIRSADTEAGRSREAVRLAAVEIARREALVAQLELDLGRQARIDAAVRTVGAIEFVVCPRCMQSIVRRNVPSGACLLCLQDESQQVAGTKHSHDDEVQRIESQLDETRQLLAADRDRLEQLEAQARALEFAATRLRAELDSKTSNLVTPRFEAIADAAAEVASKEAGMEAVNRIRSYWAQYRRLEAEIVHLSDQSKRVAEAIDDARGRLVARRQRVVEMSDLFDEIVRFLEVPWYESARIDADSYLPIVNGRSFQTLAVAGGMKTLVNLAYHLALLTYGLSRNDVMMPNVLIVDSPRKNLGHGPEDKALTDRIYRRFRMLADIPGSRVQMIIADNDLPDIAGDFVHEIHLDYDHLFVPDAHHPGPELVDRIGAEKHELI